MKVALMVTLCTPSATMEKTPPVWPLVVCDPAARFNSPVVSVLTADASCQLKEKLTELPPVVQAVLTSAYQLIVYWPDAGAVATT